MAMIRITTMRTAEMRMEMRIVAAAATMSLAAHQVPAIVW